MPSVTIKRYVTLILLALLLAPFIQVASATPYTARENPANVIAYDGPVDLKTLAIMADLYWSLDKIAVDINQSQYSQAKLDYRTFRDLYENNKDVFWRLYDSDPAAFEAINATDLTVDDIKVYLDDVNAYDDYYRLYVNSTESGNTENATARAIQAKSQYRQLSRAYDELRASAGTSMDWLDESSLEDVNASLLSTFMGSTDSLMSRLAIVDHNIFVQSGNYNLTLLTSTGEAHIGDNVTYVARLKDNESPVQDANIVLYMDGRPVASGTTDPSGACDISCQVPDTISRSRVGVYAEYTPPGQLILPTVSDQLYLQILDENSALTLSLSSQEATFGDVVNATGRLTSTRGFPAGSCDVVFYINGVRLGKAVTDKDGLCAFSFPITDNIPGGNCSVYAVHERGPGSIFLGASSPQERLAVTPQTTRLTMAADKAKLNAGGIVTLNGTLLAENGKPVSGVRVLAYVEGRQIGEGRTGQAGHYEMQAKIPYDSASGNYSLYTVYRPANGALLGSSSDKAEVHIDAITTFIRLNGMPFIYFLNDTLNVTGSMRTSAGEPVAGQEIVIGVSDSIGSTVTTDDRGNFIFSRTVNAYDPMGIYEVSAVMLTPSSVEKPPSTVSGRILILPFDKALAVTAFAILLLVLFAIVLLATVGMSVEKQISRATGRSRMEPDLDEVPVLQEALPEPKAARPSFETMSAGISDLIRSGNLKEASTRLYVAARSMAAENGVPVRESETHREFYRAMAASRPALAAPLKNIVDVYERMGYGLGDAGEKDLGRAYNALLEIYNSIEEAPLR